MNVDARLRIRGLAFTGGSREAVMFNRFQAACAAPTSGMHPRYPLSIPSFNYQMTPKISLNTRCSISISENLSINGQTRSSDQLGIWSYNINP